MGSELRKIGVSGMAEQHVLGRPVDPREMAQQVPHVSADAIIAELSRVDRNSHVG